MSKSKISVLTLDAGGTNFVFSAYRNNKKIVDNIYLPGKNDSLDAYISMIINGFESVNNEINNTAEFISIGFPGPADYRQGIIGDLFNLPAFKGGIPLSEILRHKFEVPVYINNDGNLYALGEALTGSLPDINDMLEKRKNPQKHQNLIGLTLGTGLGGGIVSEKKMLTGDNTIAAEICLLSNRINPKITSEESISIRALKRYYANFAEMDINNVPEPSEMYEICEGKRPGNRLVALKSFMLLGQHLGDVIANLITIIDGIVVIGGGIAGAQKYIIPGIKKELNNKFIDYSGNEINRLMQDVYFLNEENQFNDFLKRTDIEVIAPGSGKLLHYQEKPKTGIIFSKYDTSDMIHSGAYHFVISRINSL